MKLSDYEFFPAVTVDVADPKHIGRVKVNAPTVFSSDMATECLPWVYPFSMAGYQRFSSPREGQKVWLFRNTKNPKECWYMPMPELTDDSKELIKEDADYEEAEVVMSRNMGNMSVQIYYNDKDGLMIKDGDSSTININKDHEIEIINGKAKVILKDDHVYIGDGETGEPAVMGDKLENLLKDFFTKVQSAVSKTTPPQYSLPLYAGDLASAASSALGKLSQIKAKNTNVD